jgi:hypothetical protein
MKSLFDKSRPPSRADQIKARFVKFHKANIHVWKSFEQIALRLIANGFDHYSAQTIIGSLVMETHLKTTDRTVTINNDFSAYYARMFQAAHPDLADFFEVRRRRSEDKPAQKIDLETFHTGEPGDEVDLYRELADLAKLEAQE